MAFHLTFLIDTGTCCCTGAASAPLASTRTAHLIIVAAIVYKAIQATS